MTRIVCIGECMVELASSEAPDMFRMGFAGDTLNTAWYLRQSLGAEHDIDYLTAIGTDRVSDQMHAFFRAEGLGTAHVQRHADASVGLYMIHLSEGERSFSYWRGQSAARNLARDPDKIGAALAGAAMAYLSGITLAILPPDDRAGLLDVLRAFRAAGGKVVLDPNLRPALWPNPQTMCLAIESAAAVSDIVLPSFEDEAAWFADPDPHATAKRYAACGAGTVIVKNGGEAVHSLHKGHQHVHPTTPVARMIDTTAAGDSFNAGFLARHLTGHSLEDAVAHGCQLAASVIQARGALVKGVTRPPRGMTA